MVTVPRLIPSKRNREFNKYNETQRALVVYKFLMEGFSHRALDEEVLGLDSKESRGYQSMGILHFLGLVEDFKSLFIDEGIDVAVDTLSKSGTEYRTVVDYIEQAHKRLISEADSYFKINQLATPLPKQVGSSQFTDGVSIDKAFHDVFNPEDSPLYVKRGTARKIKILFNEKIFDAEYRYEGQNNQDVTNQSIRFRKSLKEEFTKVYPNGEGEFVICLGKDLNHFIFLTRVQSELGFEIDEFEYSEGKTYYRRHIARERNPKLIRDAKELFIKKHGTPFCEVCGFNFETHYGERGRDFIEGHHIKYVSELESDEKTKPSDIAMLCPNCHRMIHRKPKISLEELKDTYRFFSKHD